MADNELLEQILLQMKNMNQRFDSMDQRLDKIESDVVEIKETVTKNYDKTLEFYAAQQEFNTAASEKLNLLDELSVRVELLENQTIKNTVALKRYIG
ncbi:MAG: hypothetical protein Q4C61_15610 [Lachnospiraceae bacterium]|nr:hypothetical protein [Lachnospiraceae bacterium]